MSLIEEVWKCALYEVKWINSEANAFFKKRLSQEKVSAAYLHTNIYIYIYIYIYIKGKF